MGFFEIGPNGTSDNGREDPKPHGEPVVYEEIRNLPMPVLVERVAINGQPATTPAPYPVGVPLCSGTLISPYTSGVHHLALVQQKGVPMFLNNVDGVWKVQPAAIVVAGRYVSERGANAVFLNPAIDARVADLARMQSEIRALRAKSAIQRHPEHNRCYDLMQALRADLPALLAIQETLVAQ